MPKMKKNFARAEVSSFKTKENFAAEKLKEVDELKRPFFKIALLCGPPGLGKTTLAYIIAKHAGYNVVEMNASDDRSQEVFARQLEASTQMRSVMGPDPRPNCLIIDEIDGAPAPSINLLVSYIKAVKASGGTNKKKKPPVLMRPVVCICNDLYTPALRPLRQIAFVLNFPPTASDRLATRLLDIVRLEKLYADRNVLLALCEKADNDIRSCLSTLQFLKDLRKDIRMKDIQDTSVGLKDTRKSIFHIWQSIFHQPRLQKQDKTCATGSSSVLRLVQSHGEYDKITSGIFENYPLISYKDPLLDKTVIASQWLCHNDTLNHHIMKTQNYALMPYLPYAAVAFHHLLSVPALPKIAYPAAQFEHKTKLTQFTNIVESMYSYMCPKARSFLNLSTVTMQLLPLLCHIIQPTLRSVNVQLYSDREKMELKQVIAVMVAYNLTYRQERSAEGTYSYILEPAIEQVVQYPGLKVDQGLNYATKNLIARELEVEKMRRSEGQIKVTERPMVEVKVPNHKQYLRPKQVKDDPTAVKIGLDFFGRELAPKPIKIDVKGGKSGLGTGDVWFHFKEGYSNAARHTVLVNELL